MEKFYGVIALIEKIPHVYPRLYPFNSPDSWEGFLNRVTRNRALGQKTLAEFPNIDVVMATKSYDVVRVKHRFYFNKNDKWYLHEDSFFVRPEILPAHIRDKILGFDGEVDITEEIDSELAARIKLLPSPSNKNFKE